ncbi:hypothetical protein V1511DRAFT_393001 [Dipodascopsis uninucleata]
MIATNLPFPGNTNRPYEDCLTCRIVSFTALTGGGLYLLFNKRLRDTSSDFYKDVKVQNLRFVSSSIKVAGILCIAAGILRAGDGTLWRKSPPPEH